MVRRWCPRDNRQLIEFDIPHQELPVLKKPFWVFGLCGFLFYESKTLHHVDIIYINIPCLVKFHVPQLFFDVHQELGLESELLYQLAGCTGRSVVKNKAFTSMAPNWLIDILKWAQQKQHFVPKVTSACKEPPKKTSHSCLSWINGTSLDFNTPYTRFVKTVKSIAAALWKFWQTIACSKGSNYPL